MKSLPVVTLAILLFSSLPTEAFAASTLQSRTELRRLARMEQRTAPRRRAARATARRNARLVRQPSKATTDRRKPEQVQRRNARSIRRQMNTARPTRRAVLRREARLRRRQESQIGNNQTDEGMLERVLFLTNQERKRAGLSALLRNTKLNLAAVMHAADMNTRNYFAHESPEGLNGTDRILSTGYGYVNIKRCGCSYKRATGENLAKGQETAEEVIKGWMESKKHRDNILLIHYSEIGLAKVNLYWVQTFGDLKTWKGSNPFE